MEQVRSKHSHKQTRRARGDRVAIAAIVVGVVALLWSGIAVAGNTSNTNDAFLSSLGAPTQVGTTVPANGDVNPYGVAVVPTSVGKLVEGDILVSNFNSKANVQGTGTSIVEVSPRGSTQLFSQFSQLPAGMACPGGIAVSYTHLDVYKRQPPAPRAVLEGHQVGG